MKKEKRDDTFCPVALVAELLGDACTLLIVRDLLTGPKRFKDFEDSLAPVSSRTITKKLKILEEKNIITRTAYKERPPRVEYTLTKEGKHLSTLINDMRKFGEKFLS
jgi:DNA-binding HxlR family transcriptional regulator